MRYIPHMKTTPAVAILVLVFATVCVAHSLPETAPQPKVQVHVSVSRAIYKPGEAV